MKRRTTGVSVRFFNDMITTGQGVMGKSTGRTLRRERFSPNRNSEVGKIPSADPLGR